VLVAMATAFLRPVVAAHACNVHELLWRDAVCLRSSGTRGSGMQGCALACTSLLHAHIHAFSLAHPCFRTLPLFICS
jgi:hypothetical protein